VANSIGRFIHIEEYFVLSLERCIPRVLVELDVSKGIPEEMEVFLEGGSSIQRI